MCGHEISYLCIGEKMRKLNLLFIFVAFISLINAVDSYGAAAASSRSGVIDPDYLDIDSISRTHPVPTARTLRIEIQDNHHGGTALRLFDIIAGSIFASDESDSSIHFSSSERGICKVSLGHVSAESEEYSLALDFTDPVNVEIITNRTLRLMSAVNIGNLDILSTGSSVLLGGDLTDSLGVPYLISARNLSCDCRGEEGILFLGAKSVDATKRALVSVKQDLSFRTSGRILMPDGFLDISVGGDAVLSSKLFEAWCSRHPDYKVLLADDRVDDVVLRPTIRAENFTFVGERTRLIGLETIGGIGGIVYKPSGSYKGWGEKTNSGIGGTSIGGKTISSMLLHMVINKRKDTIRDAATGEVAAEVRDYALHFHIEDGDKTIRFV